MALKKRLAGELVAQFHSAQAAKNAQAAFERVVQRGEAPADVPEFAVTAATDGVREVSGDGVTVEVARFLVAGGLAPSRSEAGRLLNQGAVEIGGRRVLEAKASVPYGAIVRAGRRRYVRVVKG